MDHFCRNIIGAELNAITAVPVPDPAKWAFGHLNDHVFSKAGDARLQSPEAWVKQGASGIRSELAKGTVQPTPEGEKKKSKNKKKDAPAEVPEDQPAGQGHAAVGGVAGAAGGAAGDTGSGGDGGTGGE